MALPIQQVPTISPQQLGLQNNIIGQSQGLLNKASQGVDFNPIEERARSQFNTQTIPGLAERFTSLGGGQRSSAFQNAIGSSSADLESGLAALRSQFGLQQQGQQNQLLHTLLGYGFQPGFENVSQSSPFSQFLSNLFQTGGQAGNTYLKSLLEQQGNQEESGNTQGGSQFYQPFAQQNSQQGQEGASGTRSGVNFLLKLLPSLLSAAGGTAGGIFGGPAGAAAGGAAGQGAGTLLGSLFNR
jgi:hypothetical protein